MSARLLCVVVCGLSWGVSVQGLSAAADPTAVTVHADQRASAIHPFVYGQFIEHLGRCIYGGIWAEMLEDRKFFFPVTKDYGPYTDLKDSRFPVVGASPWQVIGESDGVTMVKESPFVGEHSPRIRPGCGIRQRDLGLVKGKKYVGYLWLKAGGPAAGPVDVTLVWGDGPAQRETHTIRSARGDYRQSAFQFTAGETTDAALLEIRVRGAGPVYVGTVSLMPADNVRGMRADTLAVLKQLNATMYRWPGGNFVSGYDWRDGIGQRDRRPPRRNPAWTGVEHNDFGIDEFIDFCRELKAEPLVTVNTGFGDAYSAAQEVEYCNARPETIGGAWRANLGHARPYGVRYWCVGNEMHGPWQLGFMQLKHYTLKHNDVARAMRAVDPSVRLIAVGGLGYTNPRFDPDEKRDWARGMLEECAGAMDSMSEHFYIYEAKDDTAAHVAQMVRTIRDRVEGHRKLQASLPQLKGRVMPIAMDEWNYWRQPYEYGEGGCVYQLRDALGVAAALHEYFRNSDVVQMAHYAQTVNVIGCVKTTKTAAFLSAAGQPLALYRREFGTTPLAVSGNATQAGLDLVAALAPDARWLTLAAVNPHGQPKTVAVKIDGAATAARANVWTIAGNDPKAFNTAEKQTVAIDGPREVEWKERISLPAYSVRLYRVPIR